MIREADEMVKELKEQMRGGVGTVTITHVMNQSDLRGKCRLMATIVMEPGCSIGPHTHDQEEEIFYIIRGSALIDDNGTLTEVGVGDAVLTGGGASHAVQNIGTEPLEMLAVILLYEQ